MTDEEIVKKICRENYCKNCRSRTKKQCIEKNTFKCISAGRVIMGIIWGLEEENEQLKAQIEKMKCCENCEKHRNCECSEDMKFYARTQKKCNYWECEK